MAIDDETVRLAVFNTFAKTGAPPTTAGLARVLDCSREDVAASLGRLAAIRHVVLDGDGVVVMAHPFAAIPLGFVVMGPDVLWWGGCAWDSFALPHLLHVPEPFLVATRCPGCGTALAWNVDTDAPPAGEEVAHFLIPVARIWDDVVEACSNQRLYCNEDCVASWLQRTGHARGYVMDLATLWRLAEHWYDGRLERGYVRREPTAAADYFRRVGLTGSFWGG